MSTVSKAVQVRSEPQGAFSQERTVRGEITFLSLHGTLDHAFEGRKTAESIHTPKVVVNMRNVRRLASWGMQEWMNFLRITAEREVYLVECSTYAASQLNLVTGLLGHAKFVSFYASYRCAKCGEEFETLFLIPNDRDSIRQLPDVTYECETCQGQVRLEEYPAAFFDAIATRAPFEIDDEVLTYCRAELGYQLREELTRFRAYRRTQKNQSYIRLLGSTAAMPFEKLANASTATTVLDLQNVQYDPARPEAWRAYIENARKRVSSLQLMNCPVGFLETLVTPADLHDKVSVRSFAVWYHCTRCETDTIDMINVAEHLELLVGGVLNAGRCSCQALLVATPTPAFSELLRSLPARERDPVLDKLIERASAEPVAKLEDALVAGAKVAVSKPGPSRALYLVAGLCVLVLAGLGIVAYELYRTRTSAPQEIVQAPVVAPQPPAPTFVRPAWITSDMASSAYCRDLIDRMMCVGVSSYQGTRDAAVIEANDAALDELVNSIGIAIKDSFFQSSIAPLYGPTRSKWLASVEDSDRSRPDASTLATVNQARHRVVQMFQTSGGAAVPAQRTDWYWEEYAKNGGGTETLVFVRYDISLEAERSLIQNYTATTQLFGAELVPAFPSLAWADPHFEGGLMITKVSPQFTTAGLTVGDLVMEIDGHTVRDSASVVKLLSSHTDGPAKLTVKTESGTKVVEVREK